MTRLMVVDDDMISRRKLGTILASRGTVEEFSNGKTAIMSFQQAWEEQIPFKLITLDITMPGMSGMEVLKEMRRIEGSFLRDFRHKAIIVMVSASNNMNDVRSAISLDCNDYIIKPFDEEKILSRYDQEWIK